MTFSTITIAGTGQSFEVDDETLVLHRPREPSAGFNVVELREADGSYPGAGPLFIELVEAGVEIADGVSGVTQPVSDLIGVVKGASVYLTPAAATVLRHAPIVAHQRYEPPRVDHIIFPENQP